MRTTIASMAALAVAVVHGETIAISPHAPIDDMTCTYSLKAKACVPVEYCAFQYQFGDFSLDQSCRVVVGDTGGSKPQQLHLAYAGNVTGTGMTISWATFTNVSDPQVWMGTSEADVAPLTVGDKLQLVVDSYYAEASYSLYSYHATISGLTPHTTYYYKVGSASKAASQSKVESFTTARAADDAETFDVLVYGDFGVDANAQHTISFLENMTLPIDFVYHIGDISYADNAFLKASEAMGFYYEETYNHWMNLLNPMMKHVPYMVTVGNHESECHSPQCFFSDFKKTHLANYSAYNSRWKMPSDESNGVKNMWYSFEHGPVHYVSISSETDYDNAPENSFIGTGINGGFGNQLEWLENDLKKAVANRKNVPWVIVGMHRAIYTMHLVDSEGKPVNDAVPIQKAFEELFIKYKVNVVVAGHVHCYERHYPIANNKPVMDGVSADGKVYNDPQAPVYIVTGAAGNTEGHEFFVNTTEISWNAANNRENYGISLMTVNRTALTFKFLGTDVQGKVLDEFTITA